MTKTELQRIRRRQRKANGTCADCENTTSLAQLRCGICLQSWRAYSRSLMLSRRTVGLCPRCGKFPESKFTMCQDCRSKGRQPSIIWYRKNVVYAKARHRQWRERNLQREANKFKDYYETHRRQIIASVVKRQRYRLNTDQTFRLIHAIRGRLHSAVRGKYKSGS